MRKHATFAIAFLMAASALGAGCTSNLDRHWGDAYRANRQAMIANPEAPEAARDATSDLDGLTTEDALRNYRNAQQRSPERSVEQSIVVAPSGQ